MSDVGRDVGTPPSEPAVTVTTTADVASAMPTPMEQLSAVKRMFEAEGEAQKRRLKECRIPDFKLPDFTQGFNGA